MTVRRRLVLTAAGVALAAFAARVMVTALRPPDGTVRVERGDLVAIFTAGAYGYTMASNYNARPMCPEVLVDGDTFEIIRKRQTYEDLIALEK